MKKIALLFILLATFTLPHVASANHGGCHGVGVGCSSDLEGGPSTPGFPSTPSFELSLPGAPAPGAPIGPAIGNPDIQSDPAFQTDSEIKAEELNASDIAQNVQCMSSGCESAFECALGRVTERLGDAAAGGLRGALRGQGDVGDMLSDVLRGDAIGDVLRGGAQDLTRGLGNYAGNLISDELRGACGDSRLGQRICGRIGNVLGNAAENFIEEQGGRLLQQGLTQLGVGNLGALFGGGSVGSALGAAFGIGSSVPISYNEYLKRYETLTQEGNQQRENIRLLTETEYRRVCEQNPLVAALNNRLREEAAAAALQAGGAAVVETPADARARAGIQAQIAYAQNLRDPVSRARAERWILEQQEGRRINACGGTNFLDRLWNEEECRSAAREFSRFERVRVEAETAYEQTLSQDASTRPLGSCIGGPNAGSTDPADCSGTRESPGGYFSVSLPGADVESARQRAEQLQFEIDADAVGEAAGSLIADIIEEITTVVEDEAESGLRRLFSDRGSDGRRGSSTYIDQLSGRAGGGGPTFSQGQRIATSNITDSLELEAQFQELTVEAITELEFLVGAFTELQSCYAQHAVAPPEGLSATDALTAAGNASTTIALLLKPQLEHHRENLTQSQGTVNNLGALLDQIDRARSAEELNAVSENYNALRNAGILYSPAELNFAAEELARYIAALKLASDDTVLQVEICTSYSQTN